jgi:hypothetical protein
MAHDTQSDRAPWVCHYRLSAIQTACGRTPFMRGSQTHEASTHLNHVTCKRCLASRRCPQGPRKPPVAAGVVATAEAADLARLRRELHGYAAAHQEARRS